MSKVTPHVWYRQYQQMKEQYPDTILLYRLGEFYEVFDDDAKLIAELLDVTLTRKDYATQKTSRGSEKLYCPMAGMPYHAVENYVSRLVEKGYRIAIAEQISETASSKSDTRPRSVFVSGLEQTSKQRGLVHREVVRVLTPGTVIEPGMLQKEQNNYLAAVITDGKKIGLSYADLSTGEFAATEFDDERATMHLESELARLNVSEILVPDDEKLQLPSIKPSSMRLTQDLEPMTKQERELLLPHERVARKIDQENTTQWVHGNVTTQPAWTWELTTSQDLLTQQFSVQSLAGFGLDHRPLATRAAGAILRYIQDTQRRIASQITSLRFYSTGSFMVLDPQTRRNLEVLEGSDGKSKGALIGVLDKTRSPMGARLLRRWLSQPLLDRESLLRRQEAVACCVDNGLMRATLRQALSEVGDMERVVNRIIQGTTIATPRDLANLRQALRALPAIVAAIEEYDILLTIGNQDERGQDTLLSGRSSVSSDTPLPTSYEISDTAHGRTRSIQEESARSKKEQKSVPAPRVESDDLFGEEEAAADDAVQYEDAGTYTPTAQSAEKHTLPNATSAAIPYTSPRFSTCSEVLNLLEEAIDEDPPALLGASNYLRTEEDTDKPRRVIRPGYDQRIDQVVRASRDAQQYINTLEAREREKTGIKSLKVDYNKVFGYYIEVSRAYSNQVPSHYERKQTLVNNERYITMELKEYESIILNAQQRLIEYEREAFTTICNEINRHSEELRATAQALARLDVIASLAEVAARGQYTRPQLNSDTTLRISAGRHSVVEKSLDEAFVPNDTLVDTDSQQILLITGPNMAGKSTVLRQVALMVLMAQIGSFVPAEAAEIGLVDRIFSRIGAQDDIATGRSTFMVEMTETAALLRQSTQSSLIILDEVGRGTSTYDGMAIAQAVVEYIHNEPRIGCRTLFATHYHELTKLETILPRVKNYHMAALEQQGRVVFLYELRAGCADRSYGIHVAELAGIPRAVIRRASELLAEMETTAQQQPLTATADTEYENSAKSEKEDKANNQQPSLFDAAPNPVVEYIKRLNVNELTPIEALTKLFELQKIAQTPLNDHK